VLESRTAQPEEFTKLQALRLHVHFVADIRQPLHCGTSFDGSGAAQLITSPTQAFGKPDDRGGNLLFYGASAMERLHQNLVRIDITLPANYLDNNKVYAVEQLTRAGVRLAQLLDSIEWQCLAKREDAAALPP
jgi:hypothetical protein